MGLQEFMENPLANMDAVKENTNSTVKHIYIKKCAIRNLYIIS